jgi:eukaryotic-like serine/threonine-protein kinase
MSAGSLRRASLGPYRVIDFVGAGGMGEVYRGIHERTGQVAAVKILTGTMQLPALIERFRNEARIHATLVHPRIARMFEYFEVEGTPCLAMEYVDGETLESLLQHRGPLPADRAVALFAGVVDAVGYLHQRGVVHRDLKTNNVKVSLSGEVKLLDFGIAKSSMSPRLTAVGSVVGTLHYLSPEQLRSGSAEPRSDIWALGVMLYELLTSRLPFDGGGLVDVTERILKASYPPAASIHSSIPRELERVIARCLTLRPDERYASCEALLTDLRALDAPQPAFSPRGIGALMNRRALGAVVTPPGLRALLSPRGLRAFVSAGRFRASIRARSSGEVLRTVRERGPLYASVLAAATGILFVGWTLFHDPVVIDPTRDRSRQPVMQVADDSLLPVTVTDERRVLIDTFGGSATVFQGGDSVGTTPYQFHAPLGAELSFLLRRSGFSDLPVRFDVTEGTNIHTYSLPRRADDSVPPSQDGSMPP